MSTAEYSLRSSGEVVSVNISLRKGTSKSPVLEIKITERGAEGDAHAGDWHRQVSLLGLENIESFSQKHGRRVSPGEFAENITLRGIDLSRARLLDRFEIGECRLELTQIGKKCHGESCAIFREVGTCLMPREGVFCRVLQGGRVRPKDPARHWQRRWKFSLLVMSDRSAAGRRPDSSGPALRRWVEEFGSRQGLDCHASLEVLPDDAERLRSRLEEDLANGVDVALVSGGTGIGPRDTTPEVVSAFCQKLLPGVMEAIRAKTGENNPLAQLSRSVAGVREKMLVYAMPGSPRAVAEYTAEIEKTLLHAFCMLHGLDVH